MGAPYHPATNGLAQRAIQTFKKSIMKSTASLDKAIIEFLTVYRRTPLPSGKSPSELLNGRQMRTWIDTLKDSETKLQREENHQFHHKYRFIKLNEKCYVINHCVTKEKPDKWLKGTITQILGSRHVKVHLDDFNKIVTRHIDQTRPLHEEKQGDDHKIYLKYSKKCGHDSIQPTPDIIPLRRSTRKAKPPLRFQCELFWRRAHKSKRRRCYGLKNR